MYEQVQVSASPGTPPWSQAGWPPPPGPGRGRPQRWWIFDSSADAAAKFDLSREGHIYGRLSNPTQAVLETRIAALEGGAAALATASGAARRAVKDVGRGLVDGHRPGPGGGVGPLLARVELHGQKDSICSWEVFREMWPAGAMSSSSICRGVLAPGGGPQLHPVPGL